jgi:hypothetical protein
LAKLLLEHRRRESDQPRSSSQLGGCDVPDRFLVIGRVLRVCAPGGADRAAVRANDEWLRRRRAFPSNAPLDHRITALRAAETALHPDTGDVVGELVYLGLLSIGYTGGHDPLRGVIHTLNTRLPASQQADTASAYSEADVGSAATDGPSNAEVWSGTNVLQAARVFSTSRTSH